MSRGDGTGRHAAFRAPWAQARAGSTPALGIQINFRLFKKLKSKGNQNGCPLILVTILTPCHSYAGDKRNSLWKTSCILFQSLLSFE